MTQAIRSEATEPSVSPVVVVHGLGKRYGGKSALVDVSFEVRRGEIFGLLGPNGAGKTTVLRLVTGLVRPSGGWVKVFDASPRSFAARTLRRRIGYLPGDLAFDERERGARLLALYARLSGRPPDCGRVLCERFGLSASQLRQPVRTYSRGMKQKLGLVAALQHDPDLVILDEPSNALDPVAQHTLYGLLHELAACGVAILLSTHVLHEALDLCDRIGVLANGRLVDGFAVRQFVDEAPRLLYLRLAFADRGTTLRRPHLPLAEFVRAEHGWLVYRVDPGAIPAVLRELHSLEVADLRIESAALEHLEAYYRVAGRGHSE